MWGKLNGREYKKTTTATKTQKYSGCKMEGVNGNHSISYLSWVDMNSAEAELFPPGSTFKMQYVAAESPGLDFLSWEKLRTCLETCILLSFCWATKQTNTQTKTAGSNPLFEAGIEELLRTEKCWIPVFAGINILMDLQRWYLNAYGTYCKTSTSLTKDHFWRQKIKVEAMIFCALHFCRFKCIGQMVCLICS